MLEATHNLVRKVGKKIGLSDQDIDELIKTDAEHEFEIELKSGKKFKAYRVQHKNKLGPYKGGIRFHPSVSLNEVRALATLMSLKTAAVGLPLGGGKGGISVSPKELTKKELEEISRKYVQRLHPHIGPDKDIPAPDVNTNPAIIDWMIDEYQKQTGDQTGAAFTGKSLQSGGSEGRDEATGRGGVIVLSEILKKLGQNEQKLSFAVQGFGNVGAHFAKVAQGEYKNWQLMAATDSSGGRVDENGLNAKEFFKYKSAGKRLVDFKSGTSITNEQLIGLNVDILVLAALDDAITGANMNSVKAKFVLELANGPVDEKAHQFLTKNGIMVIPDIIANAGGVVVSYLEWLQNKSGEHWSKAKVNEELRRKMVKAADELYNEYQKQKASLKEAAITLAIKRIVGKK